MAEPPTQSRMGLCQSCSAQPARYRCPGCSFASCSLACSAAHKQATGCSGVAPPIWSRAIPANEFSWGSLARDSSYIAGVGRAVEQVGKQLVADKVIPQGRGAGRGRDEAEAVRLDERSDKEERMVREARNEGVELLLLPKGMTKRIKNGTRWDPKNNRLEWTVEVAFQPRPSSDPSAPVLPPNTVTTIPYPSTTPLYTVLSAALSSRDKKGKGKEVDPEEAAWRAQERTWVEALMPKTEENAIKEEGTKETEEKVEDGPQEDAPPIGLSDASPEAGPSTLPPNASEPSAAAESPAAPASPKSPAAPVPPPFTSSEDSPFVLLLTFFVRPAPSSDSAPDGTQAAPSPSSRPKGRQLYLVPLSPSTPLDLRTALEGATILETPGFELWPRESFLRQKLLGRIEVVEKPSAESVRKAAGAREAERGAGRGRGRGRGRGGGGRGGYGGGGRGENEGGAGEGGFEGRRQDSGWGKRGPPVGSHEDEPEEKNPRLEQAIDLLLSGQDL